MAKFTETITLDSIDMDDEYKPLEEGDYTVVAMEADLRSNKNNNGTLLNLKMQVTGPSRAGAFLWDRINITHKGSPEAEKIGRRQLGHLMQAVGLKVLSDTDELLGKPFKVHVGIRPAHDGYNASNEIKKYMAADGAVAQATAPSAPVQKPATKPW